MRERSAWKHFAPSYIKSARAHLSQSRDNSSSNSRVRYTVVYPPRLRDNVILSEWGAYCLLATYEKVPLAQFLTSEKVFIRLFGDERCIILVTAPWEFARSRDQPESKDVSIWRRRWEKRKRLKGRKETQKRIIHTATLQHRRIKIFMRENRIGHTSTPNTRNSLAILGLSRSGFTTPCNA